MVDQRGSNTVSPWRAFSGGREEDVILAFLKNGSICDCPVVALPQAGGGAQGRGRWWILLVTTRGIEISGRKTPTSRPVDGQIGSSVCTRHN